MRHDRAAQRSPVRNLWALLQIAGHVLAPWRRAWRVRWGTQPHEPAARLVGDDLVPHPTWESTHAISIAAAPDDVWPWLVQLGQGRGGLYSFELLENLVGCRITNADEVRPDLAHLAVGDEIRLHPRAPALHVAVVEPGRALVLRATPVDQPPSVPDNLWSFHLLPDGPARCRLIERSRTIHGSSISQRLALSPLLVEPIGFVMSREMLRGIKARAEGAVVPEAPHARRLRQTADTIGAVMVMAASPLIRPLHLRWGATASEVSGPMPGDHLLARAHFTATRAITIDGVPADVWPWLVQVGFGRAGFYSYDLLDNLGRPSADEILGQWQDLSVGDVVAPMAEPATTATAFRVAEIDPPHVVVWHKPDSTWSWRLVPLDGGRTRLVTRLKVRYRARPSALVTIPLIELGDFTMMRRMLRSLRDRAEAHTAGRVPAPGQEAAIISS